jgi:hypothetical protein
VIGAIKMNDYKGISQKLLRFQDDLRQIGSVACGAKIGSIPVAPTSLRLLLASYGWASHPQSYRSEANEGCHAVAVWRRRALSVLAPPRNQLHEIPGMFRSAIAAQGVE